MPDNQGSTQAEQFYQKMWKKLVDKLQEVCRSSTWNRLQEKEKNPEKNTNFEVARKTNRYQRQANSMWGKW